MLKPDLFKFSKTADIETPRIVMQRIKSETINILIGSILALFEIHDIKAISSDT